MIRCMGCGLLFDDEKLKNGICERCFRIKHYSDYKVFKNNNLEYLEKINYIGKTGDLVIITVDFLNIIDLDKLEIKNPVLLVFTKKDLLPREVKEEKIFFNVKCHLNIKGKIFVSSKNNYHLDLLLDMIRTYQTSSSVYVVGLTSSGKSTLINKMMKNYSSNVSDITVSPMPSTTLDFIESKVDATLSLIDTPGLLDDGNIIFELNKDELKKVMPENRINPRVYQIKEDQSLQIENFVRLSIPKGNNIIMYISNGLKILRFYKKRPSIYEKKSLMIKSNEELVIKGLGFIKFKQDCTFDLYIKENVDYYIRKPIV